MYQLNFTHPEHIYFIGIGGISMSGLAEILLEKGFTVSGSDSQNHPLRSFLKVRARSSTMASRRKILAMILTLWSTQAPSIPTIPNTPP